MKHAALLVLLLGGLPLRGQQNDRPNVILIQSDDLGWGDLSCYGQARFSTPHLDRMAAEGTRFTQYYSGSTVCAPSRYALLTGHHMGRAHIRGNGEFPLREGEVNVARVLQNGGYATAVIGKYGLGLPGNSGRADRQGFQLQYGFVDHKHAHRQFTDHLFRNCEKVAVPETTWANDLFEQETVRFVEEQKAKPFFVYLNFTNPHAELQVPEDAIAEFRGKFPETPWVQGKVEGPGYKGYRSQESPRAAFAAMVVRMDRAVGRILSKLKDLGLDDRTLVLFTSDNGPHKEGGADPVFFNSNGGLRGFKRDLTEGGIRVPMIARWPGRVPAGRVSDHLWAHWDFLPTACELAGLKSPGDIDGLSMAPALLGREQKGHEFLYWEFFERGFDQAIRWGDWKGVRNGLGSPLELYDLKSDRAEAGNLASKHPDVIATLEEKMKSARIDSDRWVPKPRKP